jgi:ATP-dependent Clp protease, proteolytic subunit ClpP
MEDFNLDELMDCLEDNIKEDIRGFEEVINLDGAANREVYIGDIVAGTGQTIEGYIRFWNRYDDMHKIPVEERVPIKVYINSGGGLLGDTMTIIDAIEMSVTPVWTINTGAAYSGGFFSFIAGHKRIAYKHSTFLYHEGSTGSSGDAGKFRNFADFYAKQLDQLKDITLKYTDMSEEYYKEHQRDDLWLTAIEALELGVCDEIAEAFV